MIHGPNCNRVYICFSTGAVSYRFRTLVSIHLSHLVGCVSTLVLEAMYVSVIKFNQ